MPVLVWDKVGDRVYENGLDKGVLYLPDGSAVPWNGLTSVIEKFDKESNPVYYDGMKINDLITLGNFSATMKAVTYPDEFGEIEGVGKFRRGIFVGDQKPKTFGLCYRTRIGNDFDGDSAGYKIHVIYNVTALPSDKTYATVGESPSLVEFEWNISAIPQEVPGFRPTAHFVLNSLDLDPWLLQDLEGMFYGKSDAVAALVPMQDLITFINEWYRVKIVDNGDGTWTATSQRDGFIVLGDDGYFEINHINAVYLTDDTFVISDTVDISDVPEIRIDDNGDGTWTATTEHDGLITVHMDGTFEILNATADYMGPDSYRISDTVD